MSVFTLAISCLITSSLPWFMDLTFQVSMQYEILFFTTLDCTSTFTTGHCFHFGSVSSLFLELFFQSSPVAYWAPTDLGNSSLSVISFTLLTKVCLVNAMVFPVVMYGCESWTIKKTEHWGIDAFEQWCWRRLLRVSWTARRSNQSILKEISPEYSLEGLMLELKLWYFGHLMRRTDSFEKTLMLGKIEGGGEGEDRGWGNWMASLTQWTWVWASFGSWWWTGRPGVLPSVASRRVGRD